MKRVCASAREAYEAGYANATPFSHETIESSAFFSVMRQMHRTCRAPSCSDAAKSRASRNMTDTACCKLPGSHF